MLQVILINNDYWLQESKKVKLDDEDDDESLEEGECSDSSGEEGEESPVDGTNCLEQDSKQGKLIFIQK